MRYIELFAGIGGFRSALDRLGFECVFASEIDKYATKSYKTLYGGEELRGDITKVDAQDIPDHDLIVGGFPCQAFSVAGQRMGFEDTRGTLFFEIARIAKEKKPKWLMLENVKGLLSHDKGNTFDIMCQTLNDIGYAVDFTVLNSKYYGVPQNRERIFIVANRDAEHQDWVVEGTDVVAKAKRRISSIGVKTFNFDFPKNKTVDKRLRDILQNDVEDKFYLSQEKTEKLIKQLSEKDKSDVVAVKGDLMSRKNPQSQYGFSDESSFTLRVAQVHGVAIQEKNDIAAVNPKNEEGGQYYFQDRIFHEKGVMPALTSFVQNVMQEPEVNVVGRVELNGHDILKRVYDADGLAPTINTGGGGNREPKVALEVRPVLTPERVEKRQNGRRFKDNDEEAFTLTAQDIHGVAIKEATKKGYEIAVEGDSVNIMHPNSETRRGRVGKQIANTLETGCNQGVISNYQIRKLTPLECWRLQGFTDEQFQKCVDAGVSDSQLYKQAGNAVTVNVICELGKKLIG